MANTTYRSLDIFDVCIFVQNIYKQFLGKCLGGQRWSHASPDTHFRLAQTGAKIIVHNITLLSSPVTSQFSS